MRDNWDEIDLYGKLDDLSKLEENWDSYDAEPLDPKIMAVAHKIASAMPKEMFRTAQAVPMSNGHVQFEWHDKGLSLEIEVNSPDVIAYLKCPRNSDDQTWEEDETTVEGLQGLYDWWMRGG